VALCVSLQAIDWFSLRRMAELMQKRNAKFAKSRHCAQLRQTLAGRTFRAAFARKSLYSIFYPVYVTNVVIQLFIGIGHAKSVFVGER
jgi:hypothetical protein